MKRRAVSPLNRAKGLISAGDLPAVIAELQRAVAATPEWHAAVVALGRAWLKAGEPDRAIEVLAPVVPRGGVHRKRAEEGIRAAERMKRLDRAPTEYVRHLFDQFSDDYDRAMVRDLHYRAPAVLRSLADMLFAAPAAGFDILDLGCGTGLAGELFRPLARRMTGVDVSQRMIACARAKDIYDELTAADLDIFLARSRRRFDLLIAADTLVYFGDLSRIFRGARARLKPGGWFLFTVEKQPESGFALGPKRRYRHSAEYLRTAAAKAGLESMGILDCAPRIESGEPVQGLAVALHRYG